MASTPEAKTRKHFSREGQSNQCIGRSHDSKHRWVTTRHVVLITPRYIDSYRLRGLRDMLDANSNVFKPSSRDESRVVFPPRMVFPRPSEPQINALLLAEIHKSRGEVVHLALSTGCGWGTSPVGTFPRRRRIISRRSGLSRRVFVPVCGTEPPTFASDQKKRAA